MGMDLNSVASRVCSSYDIANEYSALWDFWISVKYIMKALFGITLSVAQGIESDTEYPIILLASTTWIWTGIVLLDSYSVISDI